MCLVATIGGEGGAFKGGQKVRSRSGLGVGLERNADAGLGGTRKKRRALLGGELLSGKEGGEPPRVRLFGCLRLIAFLPPPHSIEITYGRTCSGAGGQFFRL